MVYTTANGQRVIEFYQTRTSTDTTIAAEKSAAHAIQQNEDMRRISAWVAIVAVPTAVTSAGTCPTPSSEPELMLSSQGCSWWPSLWPLYMGFKRKQWL
jgi:magnesium transporter